MIAVRDKNMEDIDKFSEIKKCYYMNQHSIIYLMNCLNDNSIISENYIIGDCLIYLMEFLSIESHLKNTLLTLETESSFPKEVNGDRMKFETLLVSLMIYVIRHNTDGNIKLVANLKSIQNDGFLISFTIIAKNLWKESQEELVRVFIEKDLNSIYTCEYGIRLSNCSLILKYMNGTMDIISVNPNTLNIVLEIPFKNCISSNEIVEIKKPNFFKSIKINNYSTQWLKELDIKLKNTTTNILDSPLQLFNRHSNLNRELKQSKSIASQDLVKLEIMKRISKNEADLTNVKLKEEKIYGSPCQCPSRFIKDSYTNDGNLLGNNLANLRSNNNPIMRSSNRIPDNILNAINATYDEEAKIVENSKEENKNEEEINQKDCLYD